MRSTTDTRTNLDMALVSPAPLLCKQDCRSKTNKSAEGPFIHHGIDSAEVCFGMIKDIRIVHVDDRSIPVSNPFPVKLTESKYLFGAQSMTKVGEVDDDISELLNYLEEDLSITLQLFCETVSEQYARASKCPKLCKTTRPNISTCAILYGPRSQFQEVGETLEEIGLFLQDPVHCDLNVPYLNPHLLLTYFDQNPIMTSSISSAGSTLRVENIGQGLDLFSALKSEEIIPKTRTPSELATSLYSHQMQGLTFMVRRENGWTLEGETEDIWTKIVHENGRETYVNTVIGDSQSTPPPEFRGGLLADQMGLGKSLSMIALIAHNRFSIAPTTESPSETHPRRVRATLLVVPLALLQTWDDQLKIHLQPGVLKWHIFHGMQKRNVSNLGHYDIVLTTYETVARQLKKFHSNSGSSETTLFFYHWHRVVLDEAHRIQNRKSYTTKAVCALQADRRWAMSGTPIQNKLTDLASIIEFLRVYPFSDPDVFNDEITRPWLEGDQQGVLRLKKMVNAITLCRSRDSIDLPGRVDEIHHLEFSSAERKVYNEAKHRTAILLDNAMSAEYAQRGVYLNALQWLNTLRLICNHGIIDSKETGSGLGINDNDCLAIWDPSTAQKALNNMICAGAALCVACGSELSETNIDEVSADIAELDRLEDTRESYRARLSQCLFLLCSTCVSKSESSEHSACSHNPKCPTFEVSLDSSSVLKPALETQISELLDDNTPTKLKALVKDLQKFENTKSVVFSFWTFTLDLIGRLLDGASIKYTRMDGKLSADKRSEAIARFQTDVSIQVILVSITCGGTGLNLTAASRAYLLEPQWNPMLEEQAFSRIYRMGQKKDVTTIRYRMENSFEQKVVLIQDRKKDLANLTFSNARLSEADIGAGRLQYLRAALS